MPEWMREAVAVDPLPAEVLYLRLFLSVLAGFAVAVVYMVGLGRRRDEARSLPTTLVLLTLVIALVTVVIGNSVARAFGLVGALSIVRFRTVVEDTRDTAFVIFAVTIGMSIGAGYAILAALGLPAVLFAALAMRLADSYGSSNVKANLTVRIGIGHDPHMLVEKVFSQYVTDVRLTSTGTASKGASIELTWHVRIHRPGTEIALVQALNRVEGVQGVELRIV